jgi:hypothetical protein
MDQGLHSSLHHEDDALNFGNSPGNSNGTPLARSLSQQNPANTPGMDESADVAMSGEDSMNGAGTSQVCSVTSPLPLR